MIRRLADSASAMPLFSTASHPPYALVNGSDDVEGLTAGLNRRRVIALGGKNHVGGG
jgi:hypothetical protein